MYEDCDIFFGLFLVGGWIHDEVQVVRGFLLRCWVGKMNCNAEDLSINQDCDDHLMD